MLEVRNIFKSYERKQILNDISFNVRAGETVCLLGASGSGKSTLLRIIAGLELPDSGSIFFTNQELTNTPPHLRDFGLVFQDYALFPHLNMYDNIAFGLRMRGISEPEIQERVASALTLVNLTGFEKRQVVDLSGGEQQRVALARALSPRPRLLMFDEPLGALDRTLREDLLNELRTILHQTDIPAIYVTHDQEEAFTMADRLLILHDGAILRDGIPSEIWADPGSTFVANFLGLGNIIEGTITGNSKVETDVGELTVHCDHKHKKGDKVHLLLRPSIVGIRAERIDTEAPRRRSAVNNFYGVVTDIIFQQERFKVIFDNGLYFYLSRSPKIGEKMSVKVKVECLG